MEYLKDTVRGFCFGLGFALAWRILGAIINFIAGAPGGPVGP